MPPLEFTSTGYLNVINTDKADCKSHSSRNLFENVKKFNGWNLLDMFQMFGSERREACQDNPLT